jgi:hypothetical protein
VNRVARWCSFKPKIRTWVHFGGPCNVRCWYILWSFGIFYGHMVYLMDIWYILGTFGIFCCNLVYFPPFWYVVPWKSWQPWNGWIRLSLQNELAWMNHSILLMRGVAYIPDTKETVTLAEKVTLLCLYLLKRQPKSMYVVGVEKC